MLRQNNEVAKIISAKEFDKKDLEVLAYASGDMKVLGGLPFYDSKGNISKNNPPPDIKEIEDGRIKKFYRNHKTLGLLVPTVITGLFGSVGCLGSGDTSKQTTKKESKEVKEIEVSEPLDEWEIKAKWSNLFADNLDSAYWKENTLSVFKKEYGLVTNQDIIKSVLKGDEYGAVAEGIKRFWIPGDTFDFATYGDLIFTMETRGNMEFSTKSLTYKDKDVLDIDFRQLAGKYKKREKPSEEELNEILKKLRFYQDNADSFKIMRYGVEHTLVEEAIKFIDAELGEQKIESSPATEPLEITKIAKLESAYSFAKRNLLLEEPGSWSDLGWNPSWSLDGKNVFFMKSGELWIYKPSTKEQYKVSKVKDYSYLQGYFYSSIFDGKLLFNDGIELVLLNNDGQTGVFDKKLIKGILPSLSNKGDKIVYYDKELYQESRLIVDREGNILEKIETKEDIIDIETKPFWSTNDKKIFFIERVYEKGQRTVVSVYDIEDNELYDLFPINVDKIISYCPQCFQFNPYEDTLLWQAYRERTGDAATIYLFENILDYVNNPTTNPTIKDITPDKSIIKAKWSPDGKRISYLTSEWDVGNTLYLINKDKSIEKKIISGQDFDSKAKIRDFNWSPDGQKIILRLIKPRPAEESSFQFWSLEN